MRKLIAGSLAACVWLAATAAVAGDRESYYYPKVSSQEVFDRQMLDVPPSGQEARVRFILNAAKAQHAAWGPPRFVIFEKGAESQHMIIIALDDQVFETLYRARAVLAQLTSMLRGSEFFNKTGLITEATWFDLAKLLGFKDVVISDGRTWSHRVVLK